MTENTSYELSRIYAKGWSAGGDGSVVDSDDGLEATIAALNPYQVEAERERWAQGFQDARRRAEDMAARSKSSKRPPRRA
jgi:ribosome modulation factor